MVGKGVIVDANILLRAVFGQRVRQLLEQYENAVNFYTPETCFEEARRYVSTVAARKNIDVDLASAVLDGICELVEPVDASLYTEFERAARERMNRRDAADWPIAALALLLDLPIWTEDQDFFGTGLEVWTTDRIEIFLRHP
jgi:predicted nucleic acid-binding protein